MLKDSFELELEGGIVNELKRTCKHLGVKPGGSPESVLSGLTSASDRPDITDADKQEHMAAVAAEDLFRSVISDGK